MATYTFNTTAGETIAREKMIAYLNTGTSAAPVWSPLGARVEDSSIEFDWSDESVKDILGKTRGTLKAPVLTQTFDPSKLDSAETALTKIWELAVYEQNAQALANQDMIIGHWYVNSSGETVKSFAERYSACMVRPSSLGGEGGGDLAMPIDVTYGGDRTLGTIENGVSGVTFTPEAGV